MMFCHDPNKVSVRMHENSVDTDNVGEDTYLAPSVWKSFLHCIVVLTFLMPWASC